MTDAAPPTESMARARALLALRCIGAGLLIALSVPPLGWWPLAFVGIAMLDRLIADQPWQARFRRTWLVVAAWLYPSMLWMFDLTPPGYVIACASYAAYFGVAMMAIPPGRARWVALPGAFVLAEQARWSFPFGGVPLSTLPMSQADAPLGFVVRAAGPLLLVAVVVLGGIALSAAWKRQWQYTGIAVGAIGFVAVLAAVSPRAEVIDTIDVALVQGGGPQRTRAADTDEHDVFMRHLEASEQVDPGVDLVLWPENVVNIEGPITEHEYYDDLQQLARDLDATLGFGVVEGISDTAFLNAQVFLGPDGEFVDRYDKVRIVPFGEFVPMRDLLEAVAGSSGLPERDAQAGSGPGKVETEFGELGVAISWEIFFANRGRGAIADGGVLLTNPTNGSSYWLTQVQTQQVASTQLRAMETDRWVVQAAPTGFTAIVTPDGEVVDRTAISERAVVHGTVELREGDTWATTVGHWPMLVLALLSYPLAWWLQLRSDKTPTANQHSSEPPVPEIA